MLAHRHIVCSLPNRPTRSIKQPAMPSTSRTQAVLDVDPTANQPACVHLWVQTLAVKDIFPPLEGPPTTPCRLISAIPVAHYNSCWVIPTADRSTMPPHSESRLIPLTPHLAAVFPALTFRITSS